MLPNRDVTNLSPKCEVNTLSVHLENFCDILFQLMKHGTNTLHAVFIFLFSMFCFKTVRQFVNREKQQNLNCYYTFSNGTHFRMCGDYTSRGLEEDSCTG